MRRWEILEQWIFDTIPMGGTFTNIDIAVGLHITTRAATNYIQAYLDKQCSPDGSTLYVIHRSGRTKNTVWVVGMRTADARGTSHQYFSDVQRRWTRAVEPTLIEIGKKNPRARRRCERIVEAVSESAMKMLQVAVDGLDDDDEGGDGGGMPVA